MHSSGSYIMLAYVHEPVQRQWQEEVGTRLFDIQASCLLLFNGGGSFCCIQNLPFS